MYGIIKNSALIVRGRLCHFSLYTHRLYSWKAHQANGVGRGKLGLPSAIENLLNFTN